MRNDGAKSNNEPLIYSRPPEEGTVQALKHLFWNPQSGQCCTRTPLNWLSILLYYFVFLTVVVAIMIVSMVLVDMEASKNANAPELTLGKSFIGTSPGLSRFPVMLSYSPLVWKGKGSSPEVYFNGINRKLAPYKKGDSNRLDCSQTTGRSGGSFKPPCSFNLDSLGSCGQPPYGYDNNTICFYLFINNVIGWTPDPYTSSDNLPNEMPENVKELVKTESKPVVSCSGSQPIDRDHLTDSNLKYLPSQAFDLSYFPYYRQEGYLSPIVAIQVVDLDPKLKIMLTATCYLWDKTVRIGTSTDFQVYLE